jgi:sugar lactone lactonase YvrE
MKRVVLTWAISACVAFSSAVALASPPVTTLVSFNPSLGELPESLTTDDFGNLYISVGGTIRKLDTHNHLSTLATVPIPAGAFSVGVKVGPDGYIYLASGATFTEPNAAYIWRVSPSGVAKVFATLPPASFPNDMAFDDHGQLYVTDSFLGEIWKIDTHGKPTVWLQDARLLGNPAAPVPVFHAFGANGIALDASQQHLYVGNTDYGRILRVGIHAGKAAEVEVLAESDELKGADGIALDKRGTLYVAVNAHDRIATIDRHGAISVYAEGAPFDAPSSLVFGRDCGGERTLYLTSFALYRANGFIPGTPMPAIQSIPVPFAGLDLD